MVARVKKKEFSATFRIPDFSNSNFELRMEALVEAFVSLALSLFLSLSLSLELAPSIRHVIWIRILSICPRCSPSFFLTQHSGSPDQSCTKLLLFLLFSLAFKLSLSLQRLFFIRIWRCEH